MTYKWSNKFTQDMTGTGDYINLSIICLVWKMQSTIEKYYPHL